MSMKGMEWNGIGAVGNEVRSSRRKSGNMVGSEVGGLHDHYTTLRLCARYFIFKIYFHFGKGNKF